VVVDVAAGRSYTYSEFGDLTDSLGLALLAVFMTCSLMERPSRAAGPAGKLPVDPAPSAETAASPEANGNGFGLGKRRPSRTRGGQL